MSTISEAGAYDLPAAVYLRDPVAGGSLSSSGARKLLPPSAPALFKHWRDNGSPPKRAYDFGHAVHADVLGVGAPSVIIEEANYNKKAAQQARDGAYAAGKVPLLRCEYELTKSAADAVRAHPVAGPLFAGNGSTEQTLVWRDPGTGVWCRSMVDKQIPGSRHIVVDLKTTKCAEPGAVSKAVASYGYHQQGAFYCAGVQALGLAGAVDPAFVLVFVENTRPHLVTVAQLDPHALMWGDRLNRVALRTYRQCTETGVWPGYTDTTISVGLPYWTVKNLEDAQARGEFDSEDMPWPTTP